MLRVVGEEEFEGDALVELDVARLDDDAHAAAAEDAVHTVFAGEDLARLGRHVVVRVRRGRVHGGVPIMASIPVQPQVPRAPGASVRVLLRRGDAVLFGGVGEGCRRWRRNVGRWGKRNVGRWGKRNVGRWGGGHRA